MSQCGICSDLFDGVERIATTPCGHVYHTKCLLKWLDVSKSCPECRKKVQRANVVELYFNINNSEPLNPLSLCNEVQNLKTLLEERRSEACDLLNKNTELRSMVDKHENTISSLEGVKLGLEHEYRRVLSEFPFLRISLESSKAQVAELRNELHFLEDVKTVVAGAQEDADEILQRISESANSRADFTVSKKLATFCSLIKRELRRAIEEKNNVRNEVTELNKNLGLTSSKLRQSKATVKDLMKRIEQLENAASRNVSISSPNCENSIRSEPSTSRSSPKIEKFPRKYFEMSSILSGSERKEKRKMKVVVLDKKNEKVSVPGERSTSPVLFSPLPKRQKETDSGSRTGCNCFEEHSIIIRAEDIPKAGKSKKFTLVPTKKKFRKL